MAEAYENKPEVSRPKKVWRILCETGIGFLGLVAGVALFFLICNILEPLGVWLLDDHRTATVIIGCCLLVPAFVSLGVRLGGKLTKGKGKPRFTYVSSVISSSLGFLICFIWVELYEWYEFQQRLHGNRFPSDVPDGSGLFLLFVVFPLIIIVSSLVGAVIGYERSDKRERNRLKQSETT